MPNKYPTNSDLDLSSGEKPECVYFNVHSCFLIFQSSSGFIRALLSILLARQTSLKVTNIHEKAWLPLLCEIRSEHERFQSFEKSGSNGN